MVGFSVEENAFMTLDKHRLRAVATKFSDRLPIELKNVMVVLHIDTSG